MFLSWSLDLVSVPDVCPPDWPTWVCGVRPPPTPGTSGSLSLRYIIIPTLALHIHNSYTGIMRSVGGPLVLVLLTFVCGDDEDRGIDGTCTADKSDCAGEFFYVW